MKRKVLTFVILMAIIILFRGWIYRQLLTYKSIGERQHYVVENPKLIDYIEKQLENKEVVDVETAIQISLTATSQQLHFTVADNDNDPNKLIVSKSAHCVGYASFFATTCNYIFKKYNLDGQWLARPQIGQLYFLGANIHQYFNTSFFKDHDFVWIENKQTKVVFAVDPTINDYFWIDFVTTSKN